jgi:hypothetical protein
MSVDWDEVQKIISPVKDMKIYAGGSRWHLHFRSFANYLILQCRS